MRHYQSKRITIETKKERLAVNVGLLVDSAARMGLIVGSATAAVASRAVFADYSALSFRDS